jgi:ABC-2 type transport system ATP-binding protein/lipopolysaccharide transport system ATP-binding protein
MAGAAIEVDGLGKRYRLGEDFARYLTLRESLARRFGSRSESRSSTELWALRDVSFAIEEGETVGLIGRNGAGKSTLLKILARIIEPTTGVARMRGRVGALLEVGTGFHPELTGRENIFLNGSILGMSRREIAARFDAIVAFAGVERFLDTPLKRYSTGMELRLAFAVAAHVEPPILVVDEVLAVGDAEFQQRCLGRISELGRGGRTVVFVSHDMGAIQRLCTRTLWIDKGAVKQDGPTAEVVRNYLASGVSGSTLVEFEPEPGGDVTLESVAVTDPGGHPMQVVRRRDPFAVRVVFTTRRPLPDLDVAVYLISRQGTHALDECWSDTERPPASAAGPGRFEAVVTLAPRLAPGEYQLGVWIGSAVADDETHVHRDVLNLRIWPEPGDKEDAERRRIVQPDATWEMHPAETHSRSATG